MPILTPPTYVRIIAISSGLIGARSGPVWAADIQQDFSQRKEVVMSKRNRRSAFTLIEILIVVVIMAVLAATIIPQFSSSTKDAKTSSIKFNMHTLRSQIELYKVHHLGDYPAITDASLPQLSGATDVDGNISATGPDADHPYGPYVDNALPANPFDGKNNVVASGDLNGTKPIAVVGTEGGWQYDAKTGAIWPNDSVDTLNLLN